MASLCELALEGSFEGSFEAFSALPYEESRMLSATAARVLSLSAFYTPETQGLWPKADLQELRNGLSMLYYHTHCLGAKLVFKREYNCPWWTRWKLLLASAGWKTQVGYLIPLYEIHKLGKRFQLKTLQEGLGFVPGRHAQPDEGFHLEYTPYASLLCGISCLEA